MRFDSNYVLHELSKDDKKELLEYFTFYSTHHFNDQFYDSITK